MSPPSGEAHPQVSVYVDPCFGLQQDRVDAQLRLELDPRVELLPGGEHRPDLTFVDLSCKDTKVLMQLHDPVTAKSMQRLLDFDASLGEDARTRLLALSIAEFVQASWMELELEPPPPEVEVRTPEQDTAQVTPPPARELARRVATAPTRAWALQVDSSAQSEFIEVGDELRPAWGAGLGIGAAHRIGSAFVWSASAQYSFAALDLPPGRVAVQGPSARLSAGAGVHGTRSFFRAGASFRMGATRVSGRSDQSTERGASFWGPRFGPAAWFEIGAPVTSQPSRHILALRLEGGSDLSRISILGSDASRLARVGGAWIHAGLLWNFELGGTR